MTTRETPIALAGMEQARRRLERWRARRIAGSPLPEKLWAMAGHMARRHGVYLTARALGLEYNKLKRLSQRTNAAPKSAPSLPQPSFVELMAPVAAAEPACRIELDGLIGVCRERLQADPFAGGLFVFRNRRQTAIRVLGYDGQGFWLCHKRLSSGRCRFWPHMPPRRDAYWKRPRCRCCSWPGIRGRSRRRRRGAGWRRWGEGRGVRRHRREGGAYVPGMSRLRFSHGNETQLPTPGGHRRRRDLYSPVDCRTSAGNPPRAVEEAVLCLDRKSTRLNSSHERLSRMPSSA